MFNMDTEAEYLDATRDARVNTYEKNIVVKNKLLIVNLVMGAGLLFIGVGYLKTQTEFLSTPSYSQAVLGVSETVSYDDTYSDDEFMNILKVTEVDTIVNNTYINGHETKKETSLNELANSMKLLMYETGIKSQSSYTDALARELDDKSGFKGPVAVANN